MYEYFEGEVAARSAARLVLLVGGVGYDLAVPLGSDFPLDAATGRARVWAHLVVREDAHSLYGFADRDTRELFRMLLRVRGVGPTLALTVLSGIPRVELLETIVAGDAGGLTRIKGVGRKTADQILLDLRDKAASLRGAAPDGEGGYVLPTGAAPEREPSTIEYAVQALVSIGFTDKDARKSVERAAKQVDPADLETLVRTALVG